MEKIKGEIINFERKNITNDNTGEVKTMYSVNFCVKTDPIEGQYGGVLLNAYVSESSFELLKQNLKKDVELQIEYKEIFRQRGTFKRVVIKINNFDVRKF